MSKRLLVVDDDKKGFSNRVEIARYVLKQQD